MDKNARRHVDADVIRAVAISAVIFTHSVDPLQKLFTEVSPDWWWTANVYLSATRFCVPVFFMLSGMFLLDRDDSAVDFYRKRFSRILVPYVAWSLVFFLLRATVGGKHLDYSRIINELATGRAYFHLWFVYALLGLYLVTPPLRRLVKNPSYAGAAVVVFFAYTVAVWAYGTPPLMPNMAKYLGYYVFGYYAGRAVIRKRHMYLAGAAAAAGFAAAAWGTYLYTARDGAYNAFFHDYASPDVILLSAGVFVLLRGIDYERLKRYIPESVFALSISSYGIYLMHPIVLSLLQHNRHGLGGLGFGLDSILVHPLVSVPVSAALALVICTLVVTAMRRFRYLRSMV